MKTVCHVTSSHRPTDPRITWRELAALAKQGLSVTLVAHSLEGDFNLPEGVNFVAVKHELSGNRWRRLTLDTWQVVKAALKLKADCYHLHDPELLPYTYLFKLFGKKVVYDAHEDLRRDVLNKVWIAKPLRTTIALVTSLVERIGVAPCDAVVTACEEMRVNFKQKALVVAVRNFPDIVLFSPGDKPRKKQVCYAGVISEARGIKVMIRAAYQCQVKLALAGQFICEQLFEECRQMPEWSAVDWYGYVGPDKVRQLMSESMVGFLLLQASQHYHPLKLYEYLAMGLPIIATHFPQWVRFIEQQELGYCVDPINVEQVVKVLSRLTEDEQACTQMGIKGRALVCEQFSWQRESGQLIALYQQLGFTVSGEPI